MPLTWKWVLPCVMLASAAGSGHGLAAASEKRSRDPENPLLGADISSIDRLDLKRLERFVDSALLPRASPSTRDELLRIRSIVDKAARGGEAFLDDGDNSADLGKAVADVAVICAEMDPGNLELQLRVPSMLLMLQRGDGRIGT